MDDSKTDKKEDIFKVEDRGETLTSMEPMLVQTSGRFRDELADLALELTAKSTGFRRSLPEGMVSSLSDLVRSMNCYYSNLIEGHDTHPVDIERALNEDYSRDPKKRDLQLEARAHITVQQWIDGGGLDGRAATADGLIEIHKRFCELLPEDLLWVENPDTSERIKITPGELRNRDVKVGQHVAISAGALPRFLRRFEDAYSKLGNVDSIVAAAAAHHRFLWLHPFLDGNGRVARLMSYALLRESLDTGGIWSVARGLARNESTYKGHLAACDAPRRNDLDGRGNLSEETLAEFARFLLNTCIDQINFMENLVQPSRLKNRILIWAEGEVRDRTLPEKSKIILEAILYRGELGRGELAGLLGTSDRQARRIASPLLDIGALSAKTTKSPLKLVFPANLASIWMPGLFPEKLD
jgi:Fic family protein